MSPSSDMDVGRGGARVQRARNDSGANASKTGVDQCAGKEDLRRKWRLGTSRCLETIDQYLDITGVEKMRTLGFSLT